MSRSKSYSPFVIVFILISLLSIVFWLTLPKASFDARVLCIGNLVLFLVSIWSFQQNVKALYHQNLQYFLRKVYGSLFLKLILLGGLALIYIALLKKDLSKPALFSCFGLYFLYSFLEVRLVIQQRKQPDA